MKRASILAAALIAVVVIAVGVAWGWARRPIHQPIAFNHSLHVQDLGSACTDCHLYARSGQRATIPNVEVCRDCHEEALTESPDEQRLVESIQAGERIEWRKVYWVDDHVFFSHRRHAGVGEIECEVCHGQVGESEQPVTRRLVPLTMERCMKCHAESGVSNDCLLCHV